MTPIKCFMVEKTGSKDHDWRNVDTGEIYPQGGLLVGAMWDAFWYRGDDGLPHWPIRYGVRGGTCLIVKTPGGDWILDSKASNCTAKHENMGEAEGEHFCWVRHGVAPDITVDKNGKTCNAGAGSFMLGGWHGFLRGGFLVT